MPASYPTYPAPLAIKQDRERIREHIESIWMSVYASRYSMEEARKAIAYANEVIARGLADRG
jgi:hypothetical protein